MRKKAVAIIITALCISACGNSVPDSNGTSNTVSDISSVADAVVNPDEEPAEDKKSAFAEKYADIYKCLENGDYDQASEIVEEMKPEASYENLYDCLENEDYDKALRIIKAMKPEQQTETITLTLDNWETYYEMKENIHHETWNLDGQGNILYSLYDIDLALRPEYSDKLVSASGKVGYQYSYAPHRVTNIDKTTGLFETELIEHGPADETVNQFSDQGKASEMKDLDYSGGVVKLVDSWTCKGGDPYVTGTRVTISDADNVGTQYLYYPEEINIISINGELVLRK